MPPLAGQRLSLVHAAAPPASRTTGDDAADRKGQARAGSETAQEPNPGLLPLSTC